jgi:hypothetical protein
VDKNREVEAEKHFPGSPSPDFAVLLPADFAVLLPPYFEALVHLYPRVPA